MPGMITPSVAMRLTPQSSAESSLRMEDLSAEGGAVPDEGSSNGGRALGAAAASEPPPNATINPAVAASTASTASSFSASAGAPEASPALATADGQLQHGIRCYAMLQRA